MNRILKITGVVLLTFVAIVIIAIVVFNGYFFVLNFKAKQKLAETTTITENGFQFRDLNKNGKLDVYEDNRQEVESRVNDLLMQMTLEEKAGLMWHPPIGVGKKGEVLGKLNFSVLNFNSSWDVIVNKKFNHFNLFMIPKSPLLAG